MKSILALLLCLYSSLAWAENTRMNIDIPKQAHPDIQQAAKHAFPLLLDQLLPQRIRPEGQRILRPDTLVSSLMNHQQYTQVIFHEKSVIQAFKKAKIQWFIQQPRLQLRIEILNTQGKKMNKSQLFMEKMAQDIAHRWGIELHPNGKKLSLKWQWQVDGRVSLNIESFLGSSEEQRNINVQHSVPQMKQWLQQVMLKSRDAQLQQSPRNRSNPQGEPTLAEKNKLVVKRPMHLEEAAALESALRSEPNVKSLIFYGFTKQQLSYILELNSPDDDWLQQWFNVRDMKLNRTEQGWAVH